MVVFSNGKNYQVGDIIKSVNGKTIIDEIIDENIYELQKTSVKKTMPLGVILRLLSINVTSFPPIPKRLLLLLMRH